MKDELSWDEVAGHVDLSRMDFYRMFFNWSDATPDEFIRYLHPNNIKKKLKVNHFSMAEGESEDVIFEDSFADRNQPCHFIKIDRMTPDEYENGGENLQVFYDFYNSIFGRIFIASTPKGICRMEFVDDDTVCINNLRSVFPNALYCRIGDEHQYRAMRVLQKNVQHIDVITLHLKGTDFQLGVWEALLQIPMGEVVSYEGISNQIQNSKAVRAVGTAVGDNPICLFIPCHRVVLSTGELGQYRWGVAHKMAIVGWEFANTNKKEGIF
ncbi:methylated-DNA--[protein]-cysteine S-methyltransferase [Paludibacter sp. 221]|uniref:methylated-DNA--[protein]-cysteine S-methyltransferase n=1 Tax=Paludibacter sp. 221 TaxID=2302939 RepID=UPI0013D60E3E|nr:methylated-DNA--[protein]-cysteine S-methyltransferase [Paludibacter sp. 221]